jgi:asparagine synthase (glutamine-hydrolysing)
MEIEMCGICGFVGTIRNKELLIRMNNLLFHRGPDGEGYYRSWEVPDHEESPCHVGLGIRRLAIIDLLTGDQPIYNEDKSVVTVFNGEIYNFQELRDSLRQKGHTFATNSDTEVIVHSYEEYGDRCLNYFRGMFSFALWDQRNKKLLLARDPMGKKPLYYTVLNGNLFFASEIKSLLSIPDFKREINKKALYDYLTFNYIPGEESIFCGVRKVPAGCFLVYQAGRFSLKRYWDIEFTPGENLSERNYYETLRDLLETSVRLRMVSDVPLGALLSGGLDSSIVVALMSRLTNHKIKTFTVGFDAPMFYNEADSAKIIADRFRTDHHVLVVQAIDVEKYLPKLVWHFDEPFADPVALPTYIISEFASKQVKVVLTGDGADENFAGYLRYQIENYLRFFKNTPPLLQKNLQRMVNVLPRSKRIKKFFRGIFADSMPLRYATWLAQLPDSLKNEIFTEEFDDLKKISSFRIFEKILSSSGIREDIAQMSYLDFKNWLGYVHLIRLDRMSMANSLEARAPFLDKELITFCSQIPFHLKAKGRNAKYILKKAFAGIIPREILDKKKHGFTVPVEIWFRKELKRYTQDILLDSSFFDSRFFHRPSIENLLRSHFSGREDLGTTLWALLNFALWQKTFIKDIPLAKDQTTEVGTKDEILLISGDFLPVKGGISTLFYEICKLHPKIVVLTKKCGDEKAFDSLPKLNIRRVKVFNKYLQPFIFAANAYKIVKEEKIDKLICGQVKIPGLVGYFLHKLLKKPYYVHTYGPEFRESKLLTPLMKGILKKATKIIAISEFAKAQLLKENIPSSKIMTFTPGVDSRRFHPEVNAEKILKRHNLQNKTILLTVSRLDANKGIDTMINLMPEVLKKYPQAAYLIVGRGPQENYLKKLATEKSKENIIFAGEVSDEELPLYYAACDVFVLLTREVPSRGFVEGFGIVFLEASACGKPIIAGKAGGSVEAVVNKETGLVVAPENEGEILSSIEKLLEDPHLRSKIGSNGRQRVEKEFDWDIKRKQYMAIIS